MVYSDSWHEFQRQRDRERYARWRAQGWHTLSIKLDDKTYLGFKALARQRNTSLRALAIEGVAGLVELRGSLKRSSEFPKGATLMNPTQAETVHSLASAIHAAAHASPSDVTAIDTALTKLNELADATAVPEINGHAAPRKPTKPKPSAKSKRAHR